MRKLIPISLIALCALATTANAGHFTIKSITEVTYTAIGSTPYHTCLSGRSYGYAAATLWQTTEPNKPAVTGTFPSFQLQSDLVFTVEVLWHPDPGDPTPLDENAYWTAYQIERCNLRGAFPNPGSYVNAAGNTAVDFNGFNFSQTFTDSTFYNQTGTMTNQTLGAFHFAAQGSDWVGTGTFEISHQIESTGGSIAAFDQGGIQSRMEETLTLTKVGTWSVT